MAPNIYCCGAGTAADTEAVTGIINLILSLIGVELDIAFPHIILATTICFFVMFSVCI